MQGNKSNVEPEYLNDNPSLEQVGQMPGSVLLEFGTPWCGHCQAAQPLIKKVLTSYHELSHIKVYDGKGKPLGRSFKVKLWPTLILLRNGQEIGRLVRPLQPLEIVELLNTQ